MLPLKAGVAALLLALGAQAAAQEADQEAVQEATEIPMARIVGAGGSPAQCLAPVHVLEIDGEDVLTSMRGFELEAGWHRLNGRAEMTFDYCRPSGMARGPAVPDLETEFKAGVTYHVGLDHRSPDIGDWRLVIWKMESGTGTGTGTGPGEGAAVPFTPPEPRDGPSP